MWLKWTSFYPILCEMAHPLDRGLQKQLQLIAAQPTPNTLDVSPLSGFNAGANCITQTGTASKFSCCCNNPGIQLWELRTAPSSQK